MTSTSFVVRTHWYHPEWFAVALAGGAWVALLVAALVEPGHLLGSAQVHPPSHALSHAAVMTVAMMVPFVLPQVAHVAHNSLWQRRYRAPLAYLAGYLGVWILVATASIVAGGLLVSAIGWRPAIVVGFGVAVVAYLSPGRRRLVRQCAMTMPLSPRGWRADRDCALYGVATARRCVATCWVLMTAVMIGHGLIVMATATVLGLLERRRGGDVPRAEGALVIVGLGLLALALSYGVSAGAGPGSPAVPLDGHTH
ncbi:DUF2182 domain-containing protein [Mumia zhuanghuii]|uniref:DUF2182 domain-containing protein n=2 Tax=Mumia TaxID=1546255 RepID=A0ABW1QLH8_9ACTN|nr:MULTISPECIES: DUF2182 domain-containing protein [Mumia]KAA1423329.1 DUF2182 domain-containing protein [Mumia zhuanghuii]